MRHFDRSDIHGVLHASVILLGLKDSVVLQH